MLRKEREKSSAKKSRQVCMGFLSDLQAECYIMRLRHQELQETDQREIGGKAMGKKWIS